MPIDDPAVYLSVFGVAATLAGSAITAIVDVSAEVVVDDVLTVQPVAMVVAADAPAAAAGQALVAAGTTYTVRQVLKQPPDGALLRLVLARV